MVATYLAAFVAALAVALVATPAMRQVALRLGVVDHPNERKIHTSPIPYLGGMAIVLAFVAAVVAGALVTRAAPPARQVAVILGGGLALSMMGLWDDLRVVPGWIKVPAEVALAATLYASGIRAELFSLPILNLILTVGWVVGITNALNYMDNMDGLSAGVSAIAAGYLAVLAALSGQFLVASLSAALAGCALGFLWYNRPPARIFMGDTGSLFLGFLLAALGLGLRFDNIARVTFFVPIAVMAVPILDALLVSVSRMRRGLSPIQPGRDHISHRLVNIGVPPAAAVGLLYFTALACGWVGVVIAYAAPLTAYMLMGLLLVVGLFFGLLLLRVRVE